MKKIFVICYSLLFTISCVQEKEPIKFYSIDGHEFLDIEKFIRHEAHIKEMRRLSIELSLAKSEISQYAVNLIKIEYESRDKMIDLSRRTNLKLNKLEFSYNSRSNLDTLCASNGMIYYIPKKSIERKDSSFIMVKNHIQTFNQYLTSLDSLNNIIGYNY